MPETPTAPDIVLAHVDNLPPLPPVVVKLLHVTADPQATATDVVQLLRGDQSLAAKVLSLAGSAALGVGTPAKTLEQAVPLLGFAAVRNIVLAATVFECFSGSPTADRPGSFDRRELWKHALAVACAARRLATGRRGLSVDPEDGFLGGLLHDLGKVTLDAVFPKAYDRIASQADHARGDIADSERAVLGADHTVVGRRLAERWRLPRWLQEVIWLHHIAAEALPASVAVPQVIALVQLADTLAREQRIGYSGNHRFYEHSPRLAERLGLSPEQVAAAVQPLATDVAEHATHLGLDRETSAAVSFKAMGRANVELGHLNAELSTQNRRLAAAARYFQMLVRFEQGLKDWSDPLAVVVAIAGAGAVALQRPRLAAFGFRDNVAAVNLAWAGDAPADCGHLTQRIAPDLAAWRADASTPLDSVVWPAPLAVRALVAPALPPGDSAPLWLVPFFHRCEVAGGLVFGSEADERVRLAEEGVEFRSFLASLGLALGRANAQAAARRLSEDLAETNRRLQQMQAELLRSRTLSMIAEMAAGAGHELNSPLTVISGRAQMLAATLNDPEVRRTLQTISDKAHECSGIVRELMDFARPPSAQFAPVDLVDLLGEVRTEWLRHAGLAPSQVRVEHERGARGTASPDAEAAPRALANREQLATVFRELIGNAHDALGDNGGSIVLRCQAAAESGMLEVVVQDNGCGMAPVVLQRAFDPFYSHRQAGRGRGLGLPRAYRIVEAHGGRIWLESRVDEGTTAHVLLPRAPA